MLPKDIFARSIEYPKDFKSDVLDQEQFLQFSKDEAKKENYALSVASRWLLRNVENVHIYGRFVAECKNDRYRAIHGTDPDPMRKYLGSYNLFTECIERLDLTHYGAELRWKPEQGQDAHFQIELVHNRKGSRTQLKRDRREARSVLFDCRFGPDLCEIAQQEGEYSEVLSQIDVIPMPS